MTVGVDIGGTKIRAGLVDESGRTAGTPLSIPTRAWEDSGLIFSRIIDLVLQVTEGREDVKAAGVGSTGPLDPVEGVILECNNLPTMHGFPLKKLMEDRLSIPVQLDNDANALVLGEAVYGAGRGHARVLGLTLGTGLGAALVENGRIVRGANGCCGEIWTAPYRDGIIEDYASGTALSRIYKELAGTAIPGDAVAELARQGDACALETFRQFSDALAFALAWTVNMTDPDVVVLGGSVMGAADLFLERTDRNFRRFICPGPASVLEVRTSELGADAGVIGAAALVGGI